MIVGRTILQRNIYVGMNRGSLGNQGTSCPLDLWLYALSYMNVLRVVVSRMSLCLLLESWYTVLVLGMDFSRGLTAARMIDRYELRRFVTHFYSIFLPDARQGAETSEY
jgi:hypothetical protein